MDTPDQQWEQAKQQGKFGHYSMSKETKVNLDYIKADITDIKENHLHHIEENIQNLKSDFVAVSQDVSWLKKFFFIVATTSVGSLITGIISLLFK